MNHNNAASNSVSNDMSNLRFRLFVLVFSNKSSIVDKIKQSSNLPHQKISHMYHNIMYGRTAMTIWFAMVLAEAFEYDYWLFLPKTKGTNQKSIESFFLRVEDRIMELGSKGEVASSVAAKRFCIKHGVDIDEMPESCLIAYKNGQKIFLKDILKKKIHGKEL